MGSRETSPEEDQERSRGEATRLLRRLEDGDRAAAEELYPLVYDELRRLARRSMAAERRDHTLQPTALIHEAYLRLVGPAPRAFEDKGHFLRAAARAMRFVLVDHARARKSQKRGGDRVRDLLEHDVAWYEDRSAELLVFDEALQRLETIDPQLVQILELRFFGEHTIEETARLLGVSHGTVENGWRVARLWLAKDLGPDDDGAGAAGGR